jgi:hypothetical protein
MNFEDVTKVLLFIPLASSAQISRDVVYHRTSGVNCRSVFTWRLLANEVAQVGSHPFFLCFDAAEEDLEIHGWML